MNNGKEPKNTKDHQRDSRSESEVEGSSSEEETKTEPSTSLFVTKSQQDHSKATVPSEEPIKEKERKDENVHKKDRYPSFPPLLPRFFQINENLSETMDMSEEPYKNQETTDENDHEVDESPPEDEVEGKTAGEEPQPEQPSLRFPMRLPLMKEVSISTGAASFGSILGCIQKSSRDASTNTPSTIFSPKVEDSIPTLGEAGMGGEKHRTCTKGLIECHTRALGVLPTLEKFLFCIPIRYGVYTIISSEEIYFFLRSYSRILHLAMPSFFPELTSWLASTELLLCILTMVSGLFLLIGVFINPTYIFFWIDIHLLMMSIYLFLFFWLAINGSEPLYQFPLLYIAYTLAFIYSIVIVNSFHKNWDTARGSRSDIIASAQNLA